MIPGHNSFIRSAHYILGHYVVPDDGLGTWGTTVTRKVESQTAEGIDMVPRDHRPRWNKNVHNSLCIPGCKSNTLNSLLQRLSSAPCPSAGSGPSGAPSAPPAPGCPSSPDNPLLHQGYSFVAPSILFDRNNAVMTDVLEASGAGDRPGPAALARSVMMQVDWARVGEVGVGTPDLSSSGAHGGFVEARSLSEVGRGIAARLPLGPLTLLLRPQDSPFFQQYELDLREPALGQGSFSVCRRCRQLQSGQEFAVKILSRRWAGPGTARNFEGL